MSSMSDTKAARRHNPVWHQLLGLCPLLAVTTNVSDAIAIGVATFAVLVVSNVAISALRNFIPDAAPLPTYMLVIGLCTTIVVMLMQAYAFDVFQRVALFLQIVVVNCVILAQADRVARHQTIVRTFIDSVATGVGFVMVLVLVGATRQGVAFGLPLAALPPGAFLIAALLLAAKNAWASRA
jgi:Na+-translocating ferredoxin:NAD+ oxidoreductase subunit E